jgi:hypothetical protein
MSIVRAVAKLAALLGGAVITVVSLMALVGVHTDNGWARAGLAVVVALVVPLFVVERILARLSPDQVKGVATDALAVIYLGFSLAFVGVAHGYARPRLRAEAHRLDDAGIASLARLARFLAGGYAPQSPPPPTRSSSKPGPGPGSPAWRSCTAIPPPVGAWSRRSREPRPSSV